MTVTTAAPAPPPPAESPRTGPWPVPAPAPFEVPGVAHVLLSPLPGLPETACGADLHDAAGALTRCRAEAVERVTAWRPDRVGPAGSGQDPARRGRTDGAADGGPDGATSGRSRGSTADRVPDDAFAQDGVRPVPDGGRPVVVDELTDLDTATGRAAVDPAAVLLGTRGWFPAGSTGLAAAPTPREAVRAAAWEVVERDLLTRWWRHRTPAARADTDLSAAPDGVTQQAVRLAGRCTVVLAHDPTTGLAAVGAAAGPDPVRCAAKARTEALITLGQLRALLAASRPGLAGLPAPGPGPAGLDLRDPAHPSRRTLDRPAHDATGIAHTLTLLLDPRYASAVVDRFTAVGDDTPAARRHDRHDRHAAGPGTGRAVEADRSSVDRPTDPADADPAVTDDPVAWLTGTGRRVMVAALDSPEARWAGLVVRRVLCPGAHNPLPRALRPAELPVPLA